MMVRMREKRTGDWDHPSMVLREKNGRGGDGKRRAGLKFCGGCNPHYDRMALAEDLTARLGREIEWAASEAGDLDLVLAIEGCETACADLSPFEGIKTRIVTCPEDADDFILEMEGTR